MVARSGDSLWARIRGGVIPAMATPLQADGATVDVEAVPKLVDFLSSRGVVGLFVGGTTGEGILLEHEQRMRLHEACGKAAKGKTAILAHVGDNTTAGAVKLARHAADVGADSIVAVTPTFYPLPDPALVKHYAAIGAATDLPLFAYDIPQMAATGVSPAALRELAKIPTFAGLKSSRNDTNALRELIGALPIGQGLLAGFESTALASLAMGAQGLVSGLATAVPEPFVAMCQSVQRGDLEAARRFQGTINQMLEPIPANNRIGHLKSILWARGVSVGDPVPPRPPGDPSLWTKIEPLLRGLGPTPKVRASR